VSHPDILKVRHPLYLAPCYHLYFFLWSFCNCFFLD
jgi:hypothetical protein